MPQCPALRGFLNSLPGSAFPTTVKIELIMIPVGYMAKRVTLKPDFLHDANIIDVYSVSGCVSDDFADYIHHWKHNGYWLFDSPEVIRTVANAEPTALDGTTLFYYEAYEKEFDGNRWRPYHPEPSFVTDVVTPQERRLEGYDVVTFRASTNPECSPLSCNSLAKHIPTNSHCLLNSFEECERYLSQGAFNNCEPGPYRIFSVYTVLSPWP